MSDAAVAGASRPSRRLLLAALAAWVVVALLAPLAALTLNFATVVGFPLGFWIAAQGALAALALIAVFFSWRAGGTKEPEGVRPSLAFAADAIGAASIVGFIGAIAALGFDGLSLPLGLTAGMALLAIVVAPRFALYPVRTLGGFFSARFGGVWPRRAALAIAAVASTFLLAADLRAGAFALQGLTGVGHAAGVAMLGLGIAAVWIGRRLFGGAVKTGLLYPTLLVALGIALVAFAWRHGGAPFTYVTYGSTLSELAALERNLIVEGLSDFTALRPMASPFLQLSMMNFAGIVLALAFGVAALPHLLGRHASQAAVSPGQASRRAALATAWVAVILMGLSAYAVHARYGMATFIASGVETAAAPQRIGDARGLDWINVCGREDGRTIADACAVLPDQRGFLRMQDVTIENDAFFAAAPMIGGLPDQAILPLMAMLVVAAVVVGAAILTGVLEADAEARSRATIEPDALGLRSLTICAGLLLTAMWLAILGRIEIAALVADGLALLGAGLFPALALGLYWRRFDASGAIAAMAVGFLILAVYVSGVRFFPVAMYEWTGAMSIAGPDAVARFEELRAAAAGATTEASRAAALDELRRHAGTIAYWSDLRPAAFALFAVPLALIAAVLATVATRRR